MLEYDDSAFYYFFLTILTIYLVPASIWAGRIVLTKVCSSKKKVEVRTAFEAEKADIVRQQDARKREFTSCFLVHLGVIICLWILFFCIVGMVGDDSEIEQFNPYHVLGLDDGADLKSIRKAYRKLSLKYHPDKNQGDAMAAEKFMKVAKAHEALTDEEAKKNFELHGNPDGRQSLEVAIGLPTFLLEKENHTLILIVYLVALVIAVPSVVACWYNRSKQYGEKNVMNNTYARYAQFITENMSEKMLPEVFACSQEFSLLVPSRSEKAQKQLNSFYRDFMASKEMNKPRRFTFKYVQANPRAAIMFRNNLILHAHLLQNNRNVIRDELHPDSQEACNFMLAECGKLIEAMVFMASLVRQRMWKRSTEAIIHFSQFLVQGMWTRDPSMLQLPHFTESEIRHCRKNKKGKAMAIQDFCADLAAYDEAVSGEEGEAAELPKGMANFTEEQVSDIRAVCRLIPRMKLEIETFVLDENEIAEDDLITLKITVTRLNVPEGEEAKPVYAPRFPAEKLETLWALLYTQDSPRLMAVKQLTSQERVVTTEIKMRAPGRAGKYKYSVAVKSDSYVGVDVEAQHEMTVIPYEQLEKFEAHPDDLLLDEQQTLFQQVMMGNAFDDSDSDSDTEEDESGMSAAQIRKREQRQARKKRMEAVEEVDDATIAKELGEELIAADLESTEEFQKATRGDKRRLKREQQEQQERFAAARAKRRSASAEAAAAAPDGESMSDSDSSDSD